MNKHEDLEETQIFNLPLDQDYFDQEEQDEQETFPSYMREDEGEPTSYIREDEEVSEDVPPSRLQRSTYHVGMNRFLNNGILITGILLLCVLLIAFLL